MTPKAEVAPKKSESKFERDFKASRRAGVPLLAIETVDPASCIRQIIAFSPKPPVISWDVINGFTSRNDSGEEMLSKVLGGKDNRVVTELSKALRMANDFPGKSVVGPDKEKVGGTTLFIMNAHRHLGSMSKEEAEACQALWNLRDEYKKNIRTVVLLAPSLTLPEELKQDVIILDHPLPTKEELEEIAVRTYKQAGLDEPDKETIAKIAEIDRGLSYFAAEQVDAMSITKNGMDVERLWEKKRKTISQTPGLSIYSGKETFNDVKGVEIVKDFLAKIFKGRNAPTVLVFMDEIEKMFAGIGGDTSGTSQEQHGEFLRWTQDTSTLGLMAIGHPGCSKSYLAKACAGEFDIPMVELNMSALKGSLVGETGNMTRTALKVITAIGKPLILATSNSLGVLPPELRRRFQLGTWFFDLPTSIERKAVWDSYISKYELNANDKKPDDSDWTQAEIKTCCELAWRLDSPLIEAANYIVPIHISTPEKIETLRRHASGRFCSASTKGVYKHEGSGKTGGKFSVEEQEERSIDLKSYN